MRIFTTSMLLAISLVRFAYAQEFQKPLFIPPTLSGPEFNLEIAPHTWNFSDSVAATTYGVNQDYLGPTLIFNAGETVQLNVKNTIGETTTMHWHGMHVPAAADGGPHTTIGDGVTWTPSFEVKDKAATFWYHPHLHEHTELHVAMGAAGLIIVKDDEEAALNLPRTYGTDDIPLVIQTKSLDANGQITISDDDTDDIPMVNGVVYPYHEVGVQVIRFRVLNGSSGRVFQLGFSDDREFSQIGSDGGLLAAPIAMTRLQLAPGERTELLVDFSGQKDTNVQLWSFASELNTDIPGGGTRAGSPSVYNPLDGEDFALMEFRVKDQQAGAVTSMPTSLVNVEPIVESQADTVREFFFDAQGPRQPYLINNRLMDMEFINEVIKLGSTEIWTITNRSNIAHPFHVHDVQFFILDRNGVAPAANEQGLKDVVLVNDSETVRIIAKFEDYADETIPYMYHCHMLLHEDQGMMGQFIVVSDEEALANRKLVMDEVFVYPNPVSDQLIRVKIPSSWNQEQLNFRLTDLSGRSIALVDTKTCGPSGLHILYVSDEYSGVAMLEIRHKTNALVAVRRIMLH